MTHLRLSRHRDMKSIKRSQEQLFVCKLPDQVTTYNVGGENPLDAVRRICENSFC